MTSTIVCITSRARRGGLMRLVNKGTNLPLSCISAAVRPFSSATAHKKKRESILFGQPIPDPESKQGPKFRLPRTWKQWRLVTSMVWREYKSTWEGFFSNVAKPKVKEDAKEEQDESDDVVDNVMSKRNEIQSNVKRNVEFVQKEGTYWKERASEETGIHTKEDLKQWAGEQMKLASECLSEFMAGYRQGRDDEVDKMLNKYFQEMEDDNEEDKPKRKRRKPKRRTIKR